MLIVALVLAVIGLAALVTAVVTSNELIAWVCIGASVIGVLLLIIDALRERSRTTDAATATDEDDDGDAATTVMPAVSESEAAEDYPDEPVEHGSDDHTVEYESAEHEADDHEPATVATDAHTADARDDEAVVTEKAPEAKRD